MNAVNTRMQVELSEAAAYVGRSPSVPGGRCRRGPEGVRGRRRYQGDDRQGPSRHAGVHPAFAGGFHRRRRDPQTSCGRDHRIRARRRLELALCADFRVCGESAKLGQPEILLGPDPRGRWHPATAPAHRTRPGQEPNLHLPAWWNSAEALRIGLVDEVVPDAEVYTAATRLAARFATGPAQALRAAKHAIDAGLEVGLDTGLEIERLHFSALFATEDQKIGMHSFIDDGPGKARFLGH